MTVAFLFLAFFTKHFIVDWCLQPRWMWANKGKLFHPGGVCHSAFHGFASSLVLSAFGVPLDLVWVLSLVEVVFHYTIDYMKVNVSQVFQWGPLTSANYWRLLGLDQYLHMLTYFGMVYFCVRYLK